MRLIIAFFCLVVANSVALAGEASFIFQKTITAAELNRMLDQERARFVAGVTPGAGYDFPPVATASNDIEIYEVRYETQVPEQGGRAVTATGMLALPLVKDRSALPLMSYQHGTVFGKYEVPSYAFRQDNPASQPHYDNAYETRYMAGLFAGNGYALMATDYVGMGGSADQPEAYFVKASTQQAEYDLYRAVVSFLASKGIAPDALFLGGWSLGGLNTLGFLERLQTEGVAVKAAFTASAPSDPFAALSGLMFHPRIGIDAPWLNTILGLSVFSYEAYLGPPGLARRTLDPAVHDALKAIYERSYRGTAGLVGLMEQLGSRPLLDYLAPELRNPASFGNSDYGRLLAAAETYRQNFLSPVRMYYGTADEVVKPMIGQLPAIYQAILIGNLADQSLNMVSAIAVEGGNHRLTFIQAAPAAKAWMDGLWKRPD